MVAKMKIKTLIKKISKKIKNLEINFLLQFFSLI